MIDLRSYSIQAAWQMKGQSLQNRIQEKLQFNENGCWIWRGCSSGNTPLIWVNGKHENVRKVLNPEYINGSSRRCNVGICVNPDHIIPLDERQWTRLNERIISSGDCLEIRGYSTPWHERALFEGNLQKIPRIFYQRNVGAIPEGKWVLHTCDNPKCVKTEHLFLGDAQVNVADCVSKKRHAFGSRNASAKLSEADVREIKIRIKQGEMQKLIAADFNVTPTTICYINRNQRWTHV